MYPVQRLNGNFTNDLKKYSEKIIFDAFGSGLINEINLIDQDRTLSEFPHVGGNPAKGYTVTLSAAFCQFVWMIGDFTLRYLDYVMTMNVLNRTKTIKDQLIEANKIILQQSDELLVEMYSPIVPDHKTAQKFKAQLARLNKLLSTPDFVNKLNMELRQALTLLDKDYQGDPCDLVKDVDMNAGGYGEVVNSLCVKAISFVLLHELMHVKLGHMAEGKVDDARSLEQEIEADFEAYSLMIKNAPEEERFTTGLGLLLSTYILILLNPKLDEKADPIHPRPDKRYFGVYDKLMSQNFTTPELKAKYRTITIFLFNFWALIFGIPGYPNDLNFYTATPQEITRLRDFLKAYKY